MHKTHSPAGRGRGIPSGCSRTAGALRHFPQPLGVSRRRPWLLAEGVCRVPAILPLDTVPLSPAKFHKSSPSLKAHAPSLRFKMEMRPTLCQPPSPGGGRWPQAPEAMAASHLAVKRRLSLSHSQP